MHMILLKHDEQRVKNIKTCGINNRNKCLLIMILLLIAISISRLKRNELHDRETNGMIIPFDFVTSIHM